MRKAALATFLLVGLLAGPACNDSESSAPMEPAPQPTNLWSLNLHFQVQGLPIDNGGYYHFFQWSLLMDGAVLVTKECGYNDICKSLFLSASPIVKTGAHNLAVRLDKDSLVRGRGRYAITGAYSARSHDSFRVIQGSFDREVALADGESTSHTLELEQP